MDEIQVKRVYLGDDPQDGIQECMKQYGYGYTRVVYVDPFNHSYVLIATEHVRLSYNEIDMINDYLSGESNCQYLLDLDSKPIKVIE